MQPQWFEVDLNTLKLVPAELQDWPPDMQSSRSRMLEENLETVVAYNLDVLFPGERLLLVKTQFRISAEADVVAIDPLGFTRLMELKITPVRFEEVWAQALAYGIRAVSQAPDSWHNELGEALQSLPEDLGLLSEALRVRGRTTDLGRKWISKQGLHLEKAYARHGFHERLRLLVNTMRRQRGVDGVTVGVGDPVVVSAVERTYDLPAGRLDLSHPMESVEEVLTRWGGRRSRAGAEITVIAPGVNNEENLAELKRVEARHAGFHLIDAELRWDGRPPNPRVVLRWCPGYRTTPSEHHRFAIRVRDELARSNPAAATFDWSYVKRPKRRITWGHQRRLFAVTDHENGELATGAEWIVDGIAHLRTKRESLMHQLGGALSARGCQVRGKEIVAPWGKGATAPAVHLLGAYHDVVTGPLHYGPLEPHARTGGT